MAKPTDKISVRTKVAQLAKIRIARDYARCKIITTIIQHIRAHNHVTTDIDLKVELPPTWLAHGDIVQFECDSNNLHLPSSCTRPMLGFHPYHAYLLSIIELALQSGSSASSNVGGPLKKKAKIATANAFQDELQSPLAKSRDWADTTTKSKPYAARAFLDVNEVDASKLERLRAVDVKPTFDSLTREICKTYDLLEVAAMRMKAITAVSLQMKTELTAAENTIRAAEACKTPKTRRALMSGSYVEKKYLDTKFDELLVKLKSDNAPASDDPLP